MKRALFMQLIGAAIVGSCALTALSAYGLGLTYDGIEFSDGTTQTTAATNEAENAFVAETQINLYPGINVLGAALSAPPVGHRAIIEYASVDCSTPTGNSVIKVKLFVHNSSSYGAEFQIPLQIQGDSGGTSTYVGALMMRIYADRNESGNSISASVFRTNGDGTTECRVSIAGRNLPLGT